MTRWTSTVAALVLCALGAATWGAQESEARARNGLIAYTKETARCGDDDCESYVWTVRPDGRGRRRLPCSTAQPRLLGCVDILPVFSPDGARLATATNGVSEFTEDDQQKDILAVRDSRGRVLRRIPEFDQFVTGLAWSPDGARLAFNTFGPIYMVGIDGTGQTLFRKTSALDVEWSRQGRLAWTRKSGRGVMVTDRARTRVRTLRASASSVAWSPDGRRLAYAVPPAGLVKTIGVDGRGRRSVTRSCTGDYVQDGGGVAWSPDGRQLLCTNDDDQLLAVNVRTGQARVVVRGTLGRAITSFDWQRAPRR